MHDKLFEAALGIKTPWAISSSGVEADYLELVTRDVALMLLNRSPAGLDYWMEQILKLADPSAHLHLYGKREARPGRKMGHVTKLRLE